MTSLCTVFFKYLNDNQIRYCHWKSNCRLAEGLSGKTDLDLLVHIDDQEKFNVALNTSDFKKITPPPIKQFPGIEDYLGLDYQTGRLIHLHVHYNVIIGQKHDKNYSLPIENIFFENTLSSHGLYVPKPELELFILIIRANIKCDYLDLLKAIIKSKKTPYSKDVYDDMVSLMRVTDKDLFSEYIDLCNIGFEKERLLHFYEKFCGSELKTADIITFRRYLFEKLKPYKKYHGINHLLRVLNGLLCNSKVYRSIFGSKKKVFPKAGRIVALVGADGSGKSTLQKDLCAWLRWKVEARTYYLGIPKSWWVELLSFIQRLVGYVKRRLLIKPLTTTLNYLESYVSAAKWLLVARKRYCVYRQAKTLSERGGVAITDRYPLDCFSEMSQPMDGVRIGRGQYLKNSRLAHWEGSYYSKISLPEKVYVLQLSYEELLNRKVTSNPEALKEKANIVNSIQESQTFSLIDSSRPYPDVLLDLKIRIWETL